MQPVSGPGPADGDNPFEGLPFFGDLGKILGGASGQGGLQWDTTRQVAMQLATNGEAEQNIDPIERMDIEELARVADLHVSQLTGLSTNLTGRGVTVVPVTRTQWVQRERRRLPPAVRVAGRCARPRRDQVRPDRRTRRPARRPCSASSWARWPR